MCILNVQNPFCPAELSGLSVDFENILQNTQKTAIEEENN